MRAGDVLDGRYALAERIGAGGYGEVWRGLDTRIRRAVAVKVLSTAHAGDKEVERFAREAAAAGGLNHPRIVTVHDFGQTRHDGRPVAYLVMELLAGESLRAVLDRGVPPLRQALDWAAQVCEALAAAHASDVLHRDVKPGNVMVLPSGSVKVVDFGIARDGSLSDGLTTAGMVLGTPSYMAPERFTGAAVGPRADLYSLGCLLAELCTGRQPFTGGTVFELVYQHTQLAPPAPSSVRPGLPPGVDRLVLDLLAKDPADRPADATAVRGELVALLADLDAPPPAAVTVTVPVPVSTPPEAPRSPQPSHSPQDRTPGTDLAERADRATAISKDKTRELVERHRQALLLWQELIPELARLHGPDARQTLDARWQEAYCVHITHRDDAEENWRALVPALTRVFGPAGTLTLDARWHQAECASWTGNGRAVHAVELWRQLLPDLQRAHGPDYFKVLLCRFHLAKAVQRAGDGDWAAFMLRTLVVDYARIDGPDAVLTLMVCTSLARLGKPGVARVCAAELRRRYGRDRAHQACTALAGTPR